MTKDFTEEEYHKFLKEKFEEEFGSDSVKHEVTLENDRVVDFVIETVAGTLAIEVEDSYESAIKGMGQALLYASEEQEWTPMLIFPPSDRAEDEVAKLSKQAGVKEIPFQKDGESN